jgi:hypothetical protein
MDNKLAALIDISKLGSSVNTSAYGGITTLVQVSC